MTTTYTIDLFSSLDGFGSFSEEGDWGGYWGKQGPEFLAHRLTQLTADQRMVLGGRTFRQFAAFRAAGMVAPDADDPVVARMATMPTTVVSSTAEPVSGWPEAEIVPGDAVEVVTRLKAESPVPLRSHGSLSMNRALLAAGLVDRIQLTVFPVLTGRTGEEPVLDVGEDYDLELLSSTVLDGRIQELVYRPTRH